MLYIINRSNPLGFSSFLLVSEETWLRKYQYPAACNRRIDNIARNIDMFGKSGILEMRCDT